MTNGNGIKVRKRDGSETPLNLDKIHKVVEEACEGLGSGVSCLLYTSPSPRDRTRSRMPSSA